MKLSLLLVLCVLCCEGALADKPVRRTIVFANQPDAAAQPSGQKTEAPAEPAATRLTTVYRLNNASAKEVARVLDAELQTLLKSKPKLDGTVVESPVALIPEVTSNSLIVSAEQPYADRIAKRIAELDVAPAVIMIQMVMTIIDKDGNAKVLSRPQVMTLNGVTSFIEVGQGDGTKYRVQLTPRVVQPEE